MRKYIRCQCCGKIYKTKPYGTDLYTICPNCDWEDDIIKDYKEKSPANNDLNIIKARENIRTFGNIYGDFDKKPWYKIKRKVKLYI